MIFQSLRFKLTVWYVLILAVLLVSFSSFLYFTLSNMLYRSLDDKLGSLAGLIATESSSPLSTFGFGDMEQPLGASTNLKPMGKFIQVLDESGRIGQKSDNLKNVQLPNSLNTLRNASHGLITFETSRSFGNTPLRIVTLPVIEGDARVSDIARLFTVKAINRVPVTDSQGFLVGLVSRADIVKSTLKGAAS